MPSRRVLKAAEAVREVVSWAILTELRDPRVRDVTVTRVEMSGDLRQAKVYVSIMGVQTKQELSLRGLQSASGFLQSKLSDRIDTRYTPRIEFVLDQGVKHSIEISRILKEVLPPDQPAAEEEEPEDFAEEGPDEEDASELLDDQEGEGDADHRE